jgi:hypothetical protein
MKLHLGSQSPKMQTSALKFPLRYVTDQAKASFSIITFFPKEYNPYHTRISEISRSTCSNIAGAKRTEIMD